MWQKTSRWPVRLKNLESRIVAVSSEVSKACGDAITKKLKSGDTESLSSIFIAQQLKAQSVHKNGMWWHPLMIRLALGLKIKSTAAYRYIARSGAVVLPSESTVADYAHYWPSTLVLIWMRYWNYVINIKLAWMWLKIKDDIAYKNGQILRLMTCIGPMMLIFISFASWMMSDIGSVESM